jgi:hypothetical protein
MEALSRELNLGARNLEVPVRTQAAVAARWWTPDDDRTGIKRGWARREGGARPRWPVCLRDNRLLLCCALPRKVGFGETNQPNGQWYRGQH